MGLGRDPTDDIGRKELGQPTEGYHPMNLKRLMAVSSMLAGAAVLGMTTTPSIASDHDDGDADLKGRALNLTDHFAFKGGGGTELSLIMYVNPRSLPSRQYHLSTNARYEFHVSRMGSMRTAAPTNKNDFVIRIEAGAPTATGAQPITLTVLKDGNVIGTHTGSSTSFAASKANNIVTNTATLGSFDVKYFVGMRADSFYFDVIRYFQVRTFLATRFFGGTGGNGDASASLAPNCRGDAFLAQTLLGGTETNFDGDGVNLWNPASCAPDFTKNYNVTAIVVNIPLADLDGGPVFDTWSTISVLQ